LFKRIVRVLFAGSTAKGEVPAGSRGEVLVKDRAARDVSTDGRPTRIIAGIVVSFSLIALTGSVLLSALGLPDGFHTPEYSFERDAGNVAEAVGKEGIRSGRTRVRRSHRGSEAMNNTSNSSRVLCYLIAAGNLCLPACPRRRLTHQVLIERQLGPATVERVIWSR
jgi:hypothetical protein